MKEEQLKHLGKSFWSDFFKIKESGSCDWTSAITSRSKYGTTLPWNLWNHCIFLKFINQIIPENLKTFWSSNKNAFPCSLIFRTNILYLLHLQCNSIVFIIAYELAFEIHNYKVVNIATGFSKTTWHKISEVYLIVGSFSFPNLILLSNNHFSLQVREIKISKVIKYATFSSKQKGNQATPSIKHYIQISNQEWRDN